MSLGLRYLIFWPLVSVLLCAGYVLLVRAVRRDDARRKAAAKWTSYPRSNVVPVPPRSDFAQVVPRRTP